MGQLTSGRRASLRGLCRGMRAASAVDIPEKRLVGKGLRGDVSAPGVPGKVSTFKGRPKLGMTVKHWDGWPER